MRNSSASPSGPASRAGRRGVPRALALGFGFVLGAALGHGAIGPAAGQTTVTETGQAAPAASGGLVLVVSREVVMAQAQVAKALSDAEAALTAELRAEVDQVKARLAEEEQELARLRATLPREEFDRRVQIFDQTVRTERRRTQQRSAALQTAFRDARAQLVDALLPVLVQISRERGASLVLDRDQILLAHPSIDVTAEVIRRFDATAAMPPVPSLADLERPAEENEQGGGVDVPTGSSGG